MAVSKDYYKDLDVEELIQDDFFIESINKPNPESESFWNEFLMEHPDRKDAVQVAGSLIRELKFKTDKPGKGVKERVWNTIKAQNQKIETIVKMPKKTRWIWAAATIAGIILASTIWWQRQEGTETTINTQYAELKQIVLPDQTIVTLNANSNIRYKKEWKQGQPREVWLKGEAFFDVKHLHQDGEEVKESHRFIVHAGEMNVEVLGTSFNVVERNFISKVVLQTGRIRVNFKNPGTNSVEMEPCELVKFDQQSKQVVKEKTDTSSQVLWKKRRLLLDNTTVKELISAIENNFGYKVEVEQQDILNRHLSGTGIISLEDEQTLFKALEVILNVEITKKSTTLYIKNK